LPSRSSSRGGESQADNRTADEVVGYVSAFRQDSEEDYEKRSVKIWPFRVDRDDGDGNRLQSTPVVMRGLGFDGSIHDGDQVRIPARWHPGHDLRTSRRTGPSQPSRP
jgi:hypothetical protein